MFIEEAQMDWELLCCPNRYYRYYGIPFYQGLGVENGLSHGHKRPFAELAGAAFW
jgi:hypothetical protein